MAAEALVSAAKPVRTKKAAKAAKAVPNSSYVRDHKPGVIKQGAAMLHDLEPEDVAEVETPPQKLSPRLALEAPKVQPPPMNLAPRVSPPPNSLAWRPLETVSGGTEGEVARAPRSRQQSLSLGVVAGHVQQPSSFFAPRVSTSPVRNMLVAGGGATAAGPNSARETVHVSGSRSRSQSRGRSHSVQILSSSMDSLNLASITANGLQPVSSTAIAAASHAASDLLRARRAALARRQSASGEAYVPKVEGSRLLQPSFHAKKQHEQLEQSRLLAEQIAQLLVAHQVAHTAPPLPAQDEEIVATGQEPEQREDAAALVTPVKQQPPEDEPEESPAEQQKDDDASKQLKTGRSKAVGTKQPLSASSKPKRRTSSVSSSKTDGSSARSSKAQTASRKKSSGPAFR